MKKFFHKCFVSSTFVDLHAERDELLRRIHPAFRDAAARHGHDAELIELRWGVDTVDLEQAALATRVLQTCLNAVDESRPAMVIYLGDRLGWVPRREWVSDEIASKFKLKPTELDGQSITGLEIIYGLRKEDSDSPRCVICMRDLSETDIPAELHELYFEPDPVKRATLDKLKTWLREEFGDKIIDYTADFNVESGRLEKFRVKDGNNTPLAEAVTDKLISKFEDDWSEYDALPWTQRALVSAEHFAVNTAASFVGRADLIADLKGKLDSHRVIFLRGVHGSGKTAVACKLASDLLQSNRKVCLIACGGSTLQHSSRLILQQLIFFMEHEVLNLESTLAPSADYEQSKNYFFRLCQRVSADRQVYIVFDAVDMISDERRRTLDFIPTDCQNIHCLITCTNDFEIPAKFFDTTAKFDALDDEDILRLFLQDEHVDNLQDLEDVTRKKFVKFFKLFFSMSDNQVQELLQSLPSDDLVSFAVDAFKNSPAALSSKFLTIDIPELNDDEIVPVLEGMLARKDKTLYAATAQEVLKHKSARNPLWLKMADVMLNLIESEDLLDPKIRRNANLIVNLTVDFVKAVPDEPSEAAKYVLDRAVEKLCGNGSVIHEAIRLLGVSRRGLRLSDLRDMIGDAFIPLEWSFLQLYLRDSYFIERDGNQLDFAHSLIRKGIRDAVADDEFTRLEAKIGDHMGKLAVNDPLRRTDGMYYAKRLKKYELAVELFAQAFRSKDALLSAEIYHVLCDDGDGAQFVIDCFRNIKECDEETARNAVSFFIGDDFDKVMLGGSQTTLQFGRDLYAFFAEIFAKSNDSVLCQRMRLSQAMYELRLGNVDDAKEIYDEIFQWGNENIDTLIKNLDACRLLSTCCDQLAEFAARTGDTDNAQRYADENLRWSGAALAIDRTPERDTYALLTLFKKIALEIRKSGKATAEILDMAREAYGLSKNIFKKNPNDFMSLSFLCKACSTLINISVSLDQPKAALSLIAEEGERHVRHLLQYDANNLEATGIAVALLREIVIAQFKAYDFKHAVENSLETMRLLNQIYFQNPSNETAALIQEVAEEFKSVAYLSCYEINRLLEHEPTEENQKIMLEASEAMEAFSNLDALNKILGLSLE